MNLFKSKNPAYAAEKMIAYSIMWTQQINPGIDPEELASRYNCDKKAVMRMLKKAKSGGAVPVYMDYEQIGNMFPVRV